MLISITPELIRKWTVTHEAGIHSSWVRTKILNEAIDIASREKNPKIGARIFEGKIHFTREDGHPNFNLPAKHLPEAIKNFQDGANINPFLAWL